jgi:hypothetical protein
MLTWETVAEQGKFAEQGDNFVCAVRLDPPQRNLG